MPRFIYGVALAASLLPFGALAQTATDIEDPVDVPQANTLDQEPIGQLSARLAYNSDVGPVVGLGFGTDRLLGRDQTLRFNIEAQEDGSRVSFLYNNDAIFGASPSFGLRVIRSDTQASDVYDFDASVTRIEPRLTWRVSPNLSAATYAYYSMNEIDSVPAASSALIRADEGDQESSAVGIDLEYQFPTVSGGALRNARLEFGAEVGSTSRDHDFLRVTARAQTLHVVANGNVVLRSQLRLGALDSMSENSSIGDRFMLGQASIRGFEFGGFGPRDLAVASTPALGGNYYGVGRFDAQFPNAFGSSGERLTPGIFADVGSLWGLDDVAGGVAGANPVDDSSNLRASVGLSLRIDTGIGPIQMYVAHPLEDEDYDRTQTFGLVFSHSF